MLRVALERLVEECNEVLEQLASLPEASLASWMHNLWYTALIDARTALDLTQFDGTPDA